MGRDQIDMMNAYKIQVEKEWADQLAFQQNLAQTKVSF